MKVIIAGSRDLVVDFAEITRAAEASGWCSLPGMVCVTGGANGVDRSADMWAHSMSIDRVVFHANWAKHDRGRGHRNPAGPIRNRAMAEYADALIAIYRKGKLGPGTRNMIAEAKKRGLKVYEHVV